MSLLITYSIMIAVACFYLGYIDRKAGPDFLR